MGTVFGRLASSVWSPTIQKVEPGLTRSRRPVKATFALRPAPPWTRAATAASTAAAEPTTSRRSSRNAAAPAPFSPSWKRYTVVPCTSFQVTCALLLGLDDARQAGAVEGPDEERQALVLGAAGDEQGVDVPLRVHAGPGLEIAEGIGAERRLLLVEGAGGQSLDVDSHDEARVRGKNQAFGGERTDGGAGGIEIKGGEAGGHTEADDHHGYEDDEPATRHKRTSQFLHRPHPSLPSYCSYCSITYSRWAKIQKDRARKATETTARTPRLSPRGKT